MSSKSPTPSHIRMVAIDLDGTLLNDSKEVSPRTAHALTALRQRDVRVVIASARPPRSVRHIYHSLKLDTWQINYNGAMIWDEPNETTVSHRALAGNIVREVIEFARALHPEILVSCELLDRWFTDRSDQTYTTETGRLFKPDVVAPLETFVDVPMTKVMLLGKAQIITDIEPSIGMAFEEHARVVRTDPELLQIMDKRVSKAVALRKLARHYDIPMTDVMAIGDAPNNVGMLQLAGVAVAMDNAHPLVKKVAHWIAPSNNDHGVYAALAHYGLCD